MQSCTLMNIVLGDDGFLAEHTDLFYRCSSARFGEGVLEFDQPADFLTYFNALPLGKWRTYAEIDNATLVLEIAGSARLYLRRAYAQGLREQAVARVQEQAVDLAACQVAPADEAGFATYAVDVELDDAVLVGFALEPNGAVRIRAGRFETQVEPARVNPVRLAVCTTTFNNENYILPNMQAIRQHVIESGQAVADGFHLFVVDNGRTLDAAKLREAGFEPGEPDAQGRMQLPGMTVCPNPNVGGSGGFARGMMEALGWAQGANGEEGANEPDGAADASEETVGYTHVLLMDDDVHVSPESFKRTHALLSLASGRYRDAFVNGAMLKIQEPNIQFEDVSFARVSGGYERYKPDLDVAQLDDVLRNELISVEGPNSYGAWWYCCMPTSVIREQGLPLPLFVRGDDVEYGVRCQSKYMAMSGICVWHAHFVGRFRASVDGYQYIRNLLIVSAVHSTVDQRGMMMRFWRVLRIYLRHMNYDAAELWLDALEDYLRGPEWLAQADGAAIMKANGAKNEKLVAIGQLDPAIMAQVEIDRSLLGHDEPVRSTLSKLFESIPHDRHWFPDALLRKQPAVIDYSGNLGPWSQVAMRKTLVALDATGENGHVRTLDRARYRAILKRYRNLRVDYAKRKDDVAQEWQDAFLHLTSPEFWRTYLGLE